MSDDDPEPERCGAGLSHGRAEGLDPSRGDELRSTLGNTGGGVGAGGAASGMRAREEGATGVMVVLLLTSGRGASGAAIVLLRAMRAAMGGRDGSDESAKAPTLADRDSG